MIKKQQNLPRRTIPAPVSDTPPVETKMGRPSTYDAVVHPRQAYILAARLGADMKTIADIIGVARATVYDWMNTYPDFADAIKNGREAFDSVEVEGSLLKSALGFDYEEKTYERVAVVDPDSKEVVGTQLAMTKKITRHIPPNITAIMFWLQNRMPDRWKNVRKTEATVKVKQEGRIDHRHGHIHALHGGGSELVVDYSKLDRKDVEQLREIIAKSIGGSAKLPAGLLGSGSESKTSNG